MLYIVTKEVFMLNKIILITIILITAISAQEYTGWINPTTISKNSVISDLGWDVVTYSKNGSVAVSWQEKYGASKSVLCKAIFRNSKQYKLVSPENTIVLERSNINSIECKKVALGVK